MQKSLLTICSTALLVLLSVAITFAQDACGAFLEQALAAVDTSCTDIGRNQACYGFDRVEASFQMDVTDDFFDQPADVADVSMLETLRTVPFNLTSGEWGVAVMVLQANMPETLPGQNVTFILMGDTEVENGVAPETAHQPITGLEVEVTFAQGAAIRSGPGDNFNTLGGVVTGATFITDGVSDDGNWLRIVWEERPAWVRRTTVAQTPELDSLPVFNEELRTPMQAFYLRTGIGRPECAEVPDNSLLVQGPDDIDIDLTVNGANIQLGSSGILRVIDGGGDSPLLEITVLDGEFIVKADEFNPSDIVIRAGQRSTLCLDSGNNLGVDGESNDLTVTCGASPPEPVDPGAFRDSWCSLEQVPASLLNYELQTCEQRTHTVQSGENLFRISQFYCVALDDLIALNGITDATSLLVGQTLVLPAGACEGSGSTRPPAGVLQPQNPAGGENPQPAPVGCVSLIYPLQPVNSGNHNFEWSAYAGTGISYQLIFYTFEGIQAEVFETDETSYFLNLGRQTSTGGEFSWSVNVLSNGEFVCNSGRSGTLMRTGELNPPAPGSNFTLRISCVVDINGLPVATMTWSDLPPGDTVTGVLKPYGSSPVVAGPFSATQGSETFSFSDDLDATAEASTSGGEFTSIRCS